ncbi:MAG: DUF192 domain-containing protein [Halolamina sp.]
MRVVHRRGDETRVLASDAERADGTLAKARGLMFRRSIPAGYGLVFPFEEARSRNIHMLFVPFPLDVLWLVDDEVTRVERLRPWVGIARSIADTVVELPAGAADGVEAGDTVEVVD